MSAVPEEEIFHTEAIYGMETRQPLVQIIFGKATITVTPDDARAMGEQLITTAFAAEADAFLVEWLSGKVGQPLEVAVQILREFRQWRVDKEGGQ
jgi:hypothetical protein